MKERNIFGLLTCFSIWIGQKCFAEISPVDQAFKQALQYRNDDLQNWEAPENVKRSFPYYFAGYDKMHRAIFVMEFGKFDFSRFFEENPGQEGLDLYDKHMRQFYYRMYNSFKLRPKNPANPIKPWVLFVDYNGFQPDQFSSPQMRKMVSTFWTRLDLIHENLAYGFILNVPPFAKQFLRRQNNVARRAVAKLATYNSGDESWRTKLLEKIPRESLSPQYGGLEDYQRPQPLSD